MLVIENVHKHFRGVHALKGVSLKVDKGSIVAIVGDNGAGKSTLMKCISGVIKAESGTIFFGETDLIPLKLSERRANGIEMIYQDLALCKLQDVVTNVFLGREKTKGYFLDKRKMKDICQKIFKEFGIDIPLNSIAGSLSGGQQQSLAIIRAFISNSRLLIMDEPTAALGVKETENVLNHIKKLKEKQVSVIMISHRLSDVFKVADRIVVMKHGEVRYQLSPSETDIVDLTSKIMEG